MMLCICDITVFSCEVTDVKQIHIDATDSAAAGCDCESNIDIYQTSVNCLIYCIRFSFFNDKDDH